MELRDYLPKGMYDPGLVKEVIALYCGLTEGQSRIGAALLGEEGTVIGGGAMLFKAPSRDSLGDFSEGCIVCEVEGVRILNQTPLSGPDNIDLAERMYEQAKGNNRWSEKVARAFRKEYPNPPTHANQENTSIVEKTRPDWFYESDDSLSKEAGGTFVPHRYSDGMPGPGLDLVTGYTGGRVSPRPMLDDLVTYSAEEAISQSLQGHEGILDWWETLDLWVALSEKKD